MHRPCDIKDNAASLVCATAATKSSQPVPANRSNSPPFIYRRATKSTNHRSVKFLDGVQALRGWDGTMIALSASVSTSSEARAAIVRLGRFSAPSIYLISVSVTPIRAPTSFCVSRASARRLRRHFPKRFQLIGSTMAVGRERVSSLYARSCHNVNYRHNDPAFRACRGSLPARVAKNLLYFS